MPEFHRNLDSSGRPIRALWTIAVAALVLSLISVLIGLREDGGAAAIPQDTALATIRKQRTLRVGYGGFPPYVIIDTNETDRNKRVKGFAVDLVNEIAQRHDPPLQVEWIKLNWETMKADMLSNKFYFVADPVYYTVTRSSELSFSDPYSYFGIGAAIVKKGDDRFRTFTDLDRDDITIVLAEGWTTSEYARKRLSKPTFKSLVVTGDAYAQLDDVMLGRADVALNDVPTVVQYSRAHKDKVDALWVDSPPATVPGGFLLRKEDTELKNFLDQCIELFRADGTLERLDRKWKTFGSFSSAALSPGGGLVEPSESE